MLVQFTVDNFLSFAESTTFSMLSTTADQQHLDHLILNAGVKNRSLLPVVSIYGANAAGKSNVIRAVQFAQNMILRGTRPGKQIAVTPFRLGSQHARDSSFEFIIVHEGIEYSYGFKVNADRVVEEWLFGRPRRDEVRYFERVCAPDGTSKFEFDKALVGKSKKHAQFLDFIAQGTRPNQLFLTEAADRNVSETEPVIEWFRKTLLVVGAESEYAALESTIQDDAEFKSILCVLLKAAGTGISGIATNEIPLDLVRMFPGMPESVREAALSELMSDDTESVMIRDADGNRHFVSNRDGNPTVLKINPQHRARDGQPVDFDLEDESDGTRRLIHLAPALLRLVGRRHRVVLVDELDRRLHPLISRLLVETTLRTLERNRGSQLIFTTHDTNLLDLAMLRRDEIWFAEKDEFGSSHLYSLAEFKIRSDLRVGRGYLNGRFGAIPFVGNAMDLGWSAVTTDTNSEPVAGELVAH